MRLWVLCAATLLGTGCATGTPMSFRVASSHLRYRPATPAAMPRAIPSPAPQAVPARPAVASAPRGTQAKPNPRPEAKAPPPRLSAASREVVLATARALVGQRQVRVDGKRYPMDCIGLVEAAYTRAGLPFRGAALSGDNGVTALYRYAQAHGRVYTKGRPSPGDIVFFRETYDQNRDGRRNDGLTHVALVDEVAEDGTVTVIHRVSRGVVRYRMNLEKKDARRHPKTGAVLNDVLRPPGPGSRTVLTGQLFAAYASLLPAAPPAAVARR